MVSITLELDGSLRLFRAVPDPQVAQPVEPQWTALFAAAHLDSAQFTKADPQFPPPLGADTRAAWTGPYRGRGDLPVRIEAAGTRGRPVYFEIVWPWMRTDPPMPSGVGPVNFIGILVVVSFVASCLVARYNWNTGRGDTRGTLRLLVFFTFAELAVYSLPNNFAGLGNIGGPLWAALGDALVLALSYLALEPWARRQWPQAMVTWSRVLEGRLRDAAVWRDVLLGITCAITAGLLLLLRSYVDIRLGDAPGWNPLVAAIISPDLTRARTVFADVFSSVRLGVVFPLFYFWLMVLAWMLVRKRILAMIVVFPVVLLTQGGAITHWLDWVFNAIIALVLMVVF
jgi:hypothetical protein